MRHRTAYACIVVALVLSAPLRARQATAPSATLLTDEKYGFSVTAAPSWILRENTPPGMIFLIGPKLDSDARGPIIMAAANPLADLPDVKTLDDYHRRELDNIRKSQGKVLEVRDVKVSGVPAKRVTWTARFKGQEQYVISIGGVIRDGAFYGISFTGTVAQSDRLRRDIDATFSSFTLK